jgi:hypothetical protein
MAIAVEYKKFVNLATPSEKLSAIDKANRLITSIVKEI